MTCHRTESIALTRRRSLQRLAALCLAIWLPATIAWAGIEAQPFWTPTPVTKSAPRELTIAADGTLSVSATRLTLHSLLNDISVQAKLPIVLSESLEDERVSLRLEAVPLEEGLRRLLAPYDAFYLFSPSEGDKGKPSIKGVWVYPKGEGLELEPVPPTLWASTKELEAQLEDPDPGVRNETYAALIERQGARGLPIVLRGLIDNDDGVRLGTLANALDAGVAIPAADLQALILHDPLQSVRLLALEAIEQRPEAKAILESIQDDPDEVIRTTARLLLETLRHRNDKRPR
jgi:hypothetical protein